MFAGMTFPERAFRVQSASLVRICCLTTFLIDSHTFLLASLMSSEGKSVQNWLAILFWDSTEVRKREEAVPEF